MLSTTRKSSSSPDLPFHDPKIAPIQTDTSERTGEAYRRTRTPPQEQMNRTEVRQPQPEVSLISTCCCSCLLLIGSGLLAKTFRNS